MARIVTKPFVLQYPDQTKKAFGVGEIVEGDDSEHWQVQAHSEEIAAEAKEETAAEKKAREKAEKEAAKAAADAKAAAAAAEKAKAEAEAKEEKKD